MPWFESAVLGFTVGLAALTGLVFGIVPALASSRTNVNATLKEGGRSSMEGRQNNRVREVLVVAEVAIAMVLLVGAGLSCAASSTFSRPTQVSSPNTFSPHL